MCLLASAAMPSGQLSLAARAARLATSAAAMGLVFMGAIVLPVYLVPALTLVLALGLAAESASARREPPWAGAPDTSPLQPRPAAAYRPGQAERHNGPRVGQPSYPRT